MMTGPAHPNHGTAAGKRLSLCTPASFGPLLDIFVMDVSLIEVSEF